MDGGASVHPSIVAAPARPRVISAGRRGSRLAIARAPFSRVYIRKKIRHGDYGTLGFSRNGRRMSSVKRVDRGDRLLDVSANRREKL